MMSYLDLPFLYPCVLGLGSPYISTYDYARSQQNLFWCPTTSLEVVGPFLVKLILSECITTSLWRCVLFNFLHVGIYLYRSYTSTVVKMATDVSLCICNHSLKINQAAGIRAWIDFQCSAQITNPKAVYTGMLVTSSLLLLRKAHLT